MRFNGQPLASGTGFVVETKNGPALITNRHNATGRHQDSGECLSITGGLPNEIVIQHNSWRGLGQWEEVIEPLYDNDKPRWIEHPFLKEKADFVLLPLIKRLGMVFYSYNPSDPGPPIAIHVAEPVSVVGFPLGLRSAGYFPVWATGFIASEPQLDHDKLPVFLIDCRTRKGQSGSAVVTYRPGGPVTLENGDVSFFNDPVFRFLGIYSGRVNKDSDIGRVWKASAIAELIASIP
jgi:hypothetical protein